MSGSNSATPHKFKDDEVAKNKKGLITFWTLRHKSVNKALDEAIGKAAEKNRETSHTNSTTFVQARNTNSCAKKTALQASVSNALIFSNLEFQNMKTETLGCEYQAITQNIIEGVLPLCFEYGRMITATMPLLIFIVAGIVLLELKIIRHHPRATVPPVEFQEGLNGLLQYARRASLQDLIKTFSEAAQKINKKKVIVAAVKLCAVFVSSDPSATSFSPSDPINLPCPRPELIHPDAVAKWTKAITAEYLTHNNMISGQQTRPFGSAREITLFEFDPCQVVKYSAQLIILPIGLTFQCCTFTGGLAYSAGSFLLTAAIDQIYIPELLEIVRPDGSIDLDKLLRAMEKSGWLTNILTNGLPKYPGK